MSKLQKASTASASQRHPIEVYFAGRVDKVKNSLVGLNVTPQKFIDTVVYAALRNPDLAKANGPSLFEAAMRCAQDGLIPDGREAALTTFGKEVSYMPMIGGLYKLAAQTDGVRYLQAVTLYEGDEVERHLDANGWHFRYKPAFTGRGKKLGTMAVLAYTDGRMETEFVDIDQMAAIKNAARSKNVWNAFPEEMEKKAAVKRLAKRLPLGPRFQAAVDADNSANFDFDGEIVERREVVQNVPTGEQQLKALSMVEDSVEEVDAVDAVEAVEAVDTTEEQAAIEAEIVEVDEDTELF